jgi:hypothetical protein
MIAAIIAAHLVRRMRKVPGKVRVGLKWDVFKQGSFYQILRLRKVPVDEVHVALRRADVCVAEQSPGVLGPLLAARLRPRMKRQDAASTSCRARPGRSGNPPELPVPGVAMIPGSS